MADLTTRTLVESILQIRNIKPMEAPGQEDAYKKLDKWINGAEHAGLILSGPMGMGKTTILRALYLWIHYYYSEHPDYSHARIRTELECSNTAIYGITKLMHLAHLSGREGLLYADDAPARADLLFIDGVGDETEGPIIHYRGWDKSRRVFIKEDLCPIEEMIMIRDNKHLPTIISTRLDYNGIVERYGESTADRLKGSCCWVSWDFGKSFRG